MTNDDIVSYSGIVEDFCGFTSLEWAACRVQQ